jgi:4,5-dihydroxyphthalate decarboxylase
MLELTYAGGIYDRNQGLYDGRVKPEGLELNWLLLSYDEIWRRMLNHYEFDVSELSLASYLIARIVGRRLIAIPVFPARAFRHSYIFINTDSGINDPIDLAKKRVAVPDFEKTAAVWMRGILQNEYGVALESIQWFTWSKTARMDFQFYKTYSINRLSPEERPDQMLGRGELDAIIAPEDPITRSVQAMPNVRRLFPNYKDVEIAYYQKNRIFPIMHTVVIKEDLYNQCPWVAVSLFKAFEKAKALNYQTLNKPSPYPLSLIWFRDCLREQTETLGNDPWPYGLEKNRHTVETLIRYLFEQGLISKTYPLEELFAANTLTL